MKLFNKTFLALSGLGVAFGLVASLSSPVDTGAFTFIGGSLSTAQRDFRVWNNFTDAQANNNTTADPDFPGATGATQAIWKGHLEWSSGFYMGTGDQDPSQGGLGTGRANFDNTYQGSNAAAGGTNGNVHSELFDPTPGGTLAFTETPIGNGWRIRYLSGWTWEDGPGIVSNNVDLQGVACHEVGHALGLGHSSVGGATMFPSISGTGVNARGINTDDAAGIRALYGDATASKPMITGMTGNQNPGGTLTILGDNFSTTGNAVWFTNVGGGGSALTVGGLASTSGGTVISVVVPAGADDGSLLVKAAFAGNSSLSNEWAFDANGGPIGGNQPVVSSIAPSSGPEGGFTDVIISGSDFNGASGVTFDGVNAMSFNVDSDLQISATTPAGSNGQTADVTVTTGNGPGTLSNGYTYTANPTPNVSTVSPNNGAAAGGVTVTISGSNVLGVSSVTFGGVAGTGLALVDDTSLTVNTPPGLGTVDVVVTNGTGSDTIVSGYTHNASGAFVNIGPSGIPGQFGEPVLTGSGDLTPGSQAGFNITCSGAVPFTLGSVFFGTVNNPTPFFGGTFYPIPFVQNLLFPFNGVGTFSANTVMAASFPSGQFIAMQFFFSDPLAPQGVSGSNGLRLDVP
jgi:hypothetical protein